MTSPTTPLERLYDEAYDKVLEPWRSKAYGFGETEMTLAHRAGLEAVAKFVQSESGRNIIVPPEVIEAAEWYAGVPARVGKMSDFILKLAKDKA